MTFLDVDVTRVLEETLPARFGGGPKDYQLVESAAPDGRPRLVLRVHPRVPPCGAEEVGRVLVEALSAGGVTDRLMGRLWQESGVISVVREAPEASVGGKILHIIGR